MLLSNNFKNEILQIIKFGLYTYNKIYSGNYNNLSFCLYAKYSYDDVCRLLDWEKNEVANNIGGYKYNPKTNTLPIFINYHKDESISNSIKYNDYFISRNVLSWISKNKRYINSPDVLNIANSNINNTKILLFVRKNKDDNENSKEFYFLGEITPITLPKEVIMLSGDHAVNFEFLLETPVNGICVEYDFMNCNAYLQMLLFPVLYDIERPALREKQFFLNEEGISYEEASIIELLSKSLLIKSNVWEYEKEWRVILPKTILDEYDNYTAPKISKIYFGVNVSESLINDVINSFKTIYPNIKYIQLKMNDKEYAFIENEIE